MSNIQLFNYGEYPVRTVKIDGQVWWVAKDVCDVLGYSNSRDALSRHLDESLSREVCKKVKLL